MFEDIINRNTYTPFTVNTG